jgi:hypothetical protein
MRLTSNLAAPLFKVKDVYGRTIDLAEYGDKKVLIAFFRHAGCPFCNIRVHNLLKVHPALKAQGLEMIFFFESKEKVLLNSIFHRKYPPFRSSRTRKSSGTRPTGWKNRATKRP